MGGVLAVFVFCVVWVIFWNWAHEKRYEEKRKKGGDYFER